MRDSKDLVVGLDIGTSKVAAIVAEVDANGQFNVVGVGNAATKGGLRRGVVVNIEATMAAVQAAVEEAATMAGSAVKEVYTGISGSHIKGINSSGMVAIRDKEVSSSDIDRVIDTAKAVAIPNDQKILHTMPQEFIIDGQEDVKEPLGMSGVRLEVKVHIITGAVSAAENIAKCVRRCGLEVHELALSALASSMSTLTADERDLGVCLIDIGGGTTDLAVFSRGAIRHTAVIPIAGDLVTNDIAQTLRTPTKEAEDLKHRYGCAYKHMASAAEMIEVPGVGDRGPRQMSRQTLSEVIEPRIEELFGFIQAELRRSGFEDVLSSGVVLTGGTSQMPGMVELAEEVFQMPVRLGVPHYQGSLAEVIADPRYSTAIGLLQLGAENWQHALEVREANKGIGGMFSRVIKLWSENF